MGRKNAKTAAEGKTLYGELSENLKWWRIMDSFLQGTAMVRRHILGKDNTPILNRINRLNGYLVNPE
jgi:hypothetical protein